MDQVATAGAYVALSAAILASGTMIGGFVYYFIHLLREPAEWPEG
jgi:hypothetical protein